MFGGDESKKEEKEMIEYYKAHKKIVDLVAGIVVGVAIITSFMIAIFIGGEIVGASSDGAGSGEIIGTITINSADYDTEYDEGDEFVFDKTTASMKAMIYDPLAEVENDDASAEPEYGVVTTIAELSADEYGFKINGEGELFMDAEDVIMTADTVTVDIVLVDYPTVSESIDVEVTASETDTETD